MAEDAELLELREMAKREGLWIPTGYGKNAFAIMCASRYEANTVNGMERTEAHFTSSDSEDSNFEEEVREEIARLRMAKVAKAKAKRVKAKKKLPTSLPSPPQPPSQPPARHSPILSPMLARCSPVPPDLPFPLPAQHSPIPPLPSPQPPSQPPAPHSPILSPMLARCSPVPPRLPFPLPAQHPPIPPPPPPYLPSPPQPQCPPAMPFLLGLPFLSSCRGGMEIDNEEKKINQEKTANKLHWVEFSDEDNEESTSRFRALDNLQSPKNTKPLQSNCKNCDEVSQEDTGHDDVSMELCSSHHPHGAAVRRAMAAVSRGTVGEGEQTRKGGHGREVSNQSVSAQSFTPTSNKSLNESKMIRETSRRTRRQSTTPYGSGDNMRFVPPDIVSSKRKWKESQLGIINNQYRSHGSSDSASESNVNVTRLGSTSRRQVNTKKNLERRRSRRIGDVDASDGREDVQSVGDGEAGDGGEDVSRNKKSLGSRRSRRIGDVDASSDGREDVQSVGDGEAGDGGEDVSRNKKSLGSRRSRRIGDVDASSDGREDVQSVGDGEAGDGGEDVSRNKKSLGSRRSWRIGGVDASSDGREAVQTVSGSGAGFEDGGEVGFEDDGEAGFEDDGEAGFEDDGEAGFEDDGEAGFEDDGEAGFEDDGEAGFEDDGDDGEGINAGGGGENGVDVSSLSSQNHSEQQSLKTTKSTQSIHKVCGEVSKGDMGDDGGGAVQPQVSPLPHSAAVRRARTAVSKTSVKGVGDGARGREGGHERKVGNERAPAQEDTATSNKSLAESKMIIETSRRTRSQGPTPYGSGDGMWFVPPDIVSSRRKRKQSRLGQHSIINDQHKSHSSSDIASESNVNVTKLAHTSRRQVSTKKNIERRRIRRIGGVGESSDSREDVQTVGDGEAGDGGEDVNSNKKLGKRRIRRIGGVGESSDGREDVQTVSDGEGGFDGDTQQGVDGEDNEPGCGADNWLADVDSCKEHDDLDITTTPSGRKYIRIGVDKKTSATPGRRRGLRTRVAPVKTWENHKVEYNTRRRSGLKITGVLVPHKMGKEESKSKKHKKNVFRDDSSFPDFERLDTDGNIFPEKVVHTLKSGVGLTNDMEALDFNVCRLFLDDFTSQGFITISAGGMKDRCKTSQHQFTFLVVKGSVMFQINEQTYEVAAGEAVVRVPTDVCYSIRNLNGRSAAELYYYSRLNYPSE